MSRSLCLVVFLVFIGLVGLIGLVACGGPDKKSTEPTNAKEKQAREARASAADDGGTKHWGKWRYKGARDSCFFIVGATCFKTENAACQTARCKKPKTCTAVGAAPATVSCK